MAQKLKWSFISHNNETTHITNHHSLLNVAQLQSYVPAWTMLRKLFHVCLHWYSSSSSTTWNTCTKILWCVRRMHHAGSEMEVVDYLTSLIRIR